MAAGTDIFISYKREEEDLARAYAAAFDKLNYLVVTDLNVPEGTEFGDAIDTMIGEASLVVVLWTPGAADSRWVRSEAIEADRQGKYLGVAAKPINENDVPLEVRHSQYLDVSEMSQAEAICTVTDSATARVEEHRRATRAEQTQQQRIAEDMEFFAKVHSVGEPSGYQTYLDLYPRGVFHKEAKAQVSGWSAWFRRTLGTPTALIQTTFAILGVVIAAYAAFGSAPTTDDGSEQIAQLQQEKTDLQDQFYELQDKNIKLVQEYNKREAELAEIRQQLAEVSQTDLAEHQVLQQEKQNLTRQLAEKQTELDKAVGAYADENAIRMMAEHQVDQLTSSVQSLQMELVAQQKRVTTLEAEVTSAKSTRGDLETRLAAAKSEVERLQGELEALQVSVTPTAKPAPTSSASDDQAIEAMRRKARQDFGCNNGNGVWLLNRCRAFDTEGLNALGLRISDLTPFAALTELKWLQLDDSEVSDLSPLQGLSGLRRLSLRNTHINSLDPLRELSELRELNISNTLVSDLSPLEGLSELQELWFTDTPVDDISVLKGLTGLDRLSLKNTLVDDLSPLTEMSNPPGRLYLEGAVKLTSLKPLTQIESLHHISLPNGVVAGHWGIDTPENRAAVQRAIRQWRP